jgi:hypothetical protein
VYNEDGWICYVAATVEGEGGVKKKIMEERKQNGKCKLECKKLKES